MTPSPPALLTAEANSQPEHQIMPACTRGYLVPNKAGMRERAGMNGRGQKYRREVGGEQVVGTGKGRWQDLRLKSQGIRHKA